MNLIKLYYQRLRNREVKESYALVLILFNFSTGFIGPIYMLFLLSQGLNVLQANTVNIFFMITLFLLQTPTGAIADMFGRKRAIVIGQLFWSLSAGIYFFSHSFWQFVAAEICAAAGRSFITGAFESWLYDQLMVEGKEIHYRRIYAKAAAWSRLAVIPAGLIAGFVGSKISLRLPLLFASMCALITFFISLKILKTDSVSPHKTEEQAGVSNNRRLFRLTAEAFHIAFRNSSIRGLILILLISSFGVQAFNMFWPVVFSQAFNQSVLGIIFSLTTLAIAIGFAITSKEALFKRHPLLSLAIIEGIIGIPILMGTILPIPLFLLVVFLLHEIGRGAFEPIFSSYINEFIPSRFRASVNSVSSMFANIGSVLGLFVSGVVAMRFGSLMAWRVSALAILGILPIIILLYRQHKKETVNGGKNSGMV